jgi:histidine phosphotransferase ChpT
MDALILAELLCARLCHDMSGPVGAAAAGAELIADMGGAVDAETVALVSVSAGAGAARLKFFRSALGPSLSGPVDVGGLHDQVSLYLDSLSSSVSGLGLDWRVDAGRMEAPTARLLLNLILLAKDALPRGGRIAVDMVAGLPRVTALGEPSGLPDEVRAVLDDGVFPASPRGAQAYLARSLADQVGRGLIVESFDGGVGFAVAPCR